MITFNNDDLETIILSNPPKQKIDFILVDVSEQVLHKISLLRPKKAKELENLVLPIFYEVQPWLFSNS